MHCPVCRAQVDQGPQCRRCRADLSLLFALEEQRTRALAMAYQSMRRGRLSQALAIVDGADALRSDGESKRLQALLHLLERDFARAWHGYAASLQSFRDQSETG
jgi:hypothetical protein